MDDLRKSTQRLYLNNFHDKARQQTIDYILGKEKHQRFPKIASVTSEMIVS
jgi:hypothetical protein